MSVEDGLLLESLTYSALQHGAEFLAWLRQRRTPNRESRESRLPVTVNRDGDRLTITLNRADKHNAFSASMREGLCEALALAETDYSIGQVILQGAGPSFCAGGDLEEFGLARDAALAHLTSHNPFAGAPDRSYFQAHHRSTAWCLHWCGYRDDRIRRACDGRDEPTLRFPK